MPAYRLLIEYDGTAYRGWQRQSGDPTIQASIEDALAILLREKIVIAGAGRTDAGVHARGQVASFTAANGIDTGKIVAGLNGILPDDIAILACDEAGPEFHARFSATGRRYSYTISTRPAAIDRRKVWEVGWKLDRDAMARAASAIIGRHDFTSFCRAGADVEHFLCDVRSAAWTAGAGLLRFDIAADRFLHGMVRALVGTMVNVGRGYTPLEDIGTMLSLRDRTEAGPAAPPCGLVLEEVYY